MSQETEKHPRDHETLKGHAGLEAELRAAVLGGRLHHAFMICGARGTGKATLAYKLARFVLSFGKTRAAPGEGLSVGRQNPVFRHIAASSHPDFLCLSSEAEGVLRVDDIRRARGFFETSAAHDGYRVCLVDCADDMNRNAANALLKSLEEPPPLGLFLLIAHRPQMMLPTIRSRCRMLRLAPLKEADMQAVLEAQSARLDDAATGEILAHAHGSPGRALAIARGGLDLRRDMQNLLNAASLKADALHSFCDTFTRKDNRFDLFVAFLLEEILAEAKTKTGRKLEARLRLWENTLAQQSAAAGVNMDLPHTALNMLIAARDTLGQEVKTPHG